MGQFYIITEETKTKDTQIKVMKYTVKRFSQKESLEDIYKTILNPIIHEADKVYGKKSLYIPRLLENGKVKEGKTLLIGQHPDANLKSDSCYEIFNGLWKDSSGKYWTEKSGFLGRKTWKEVEDPKKYMSEIYRRFNISSRDLSKISQPLFITSLFTPAANPFDLNFFLTDLTFKSNTLLDGMVDITFKKFQTLSNLFTIKSLINLKN